MPNPHLRTAGRVKHPSRDHLARSIGCLADINQFSATVLAILHRNFLLTEWMPRVFWPCTKFVMGRMDYRWLSVARITTDRIKEIPPRRSGSSPLDARRGAAASRFPGRPSGLIAPLVLVLFRGGGVARLGLTLKRSEVYYRLLLLATFVHEGIRASKRAVGRTGRIWSRGKVKPLCLVCHALLARGNRQKFPKRAVTVRSAP